MKIGSIVLSSLFLKVLKKFNVDNSFNEISLLQNMILKKQNKKRKLKL